MPGGEAAAEDDDEIDVDEELYDDDDEDYYQEEPEHKQREVHGEGPGETGGGRSAAGLGAGGVHDMSQEVSIEAEYQMHQAYTDGRPIQQRSGQRHPGMAGAFMQVQ